MYKNTSASIDDMKFQPLDASMSEAIVATVSEEARLFAMSVLTDEELQKALIKFFEENRIEHSDG